MSIAAAPREAHRLLETAWDCGIRYFDTAPLYAYGEAEKLLGQLLRGRQDEARVCTKVGLYPPRIPPCCLSLGHRGLALLKGLRQPRNAVVRWLRRSIKRDSPSCHFDVHRAQLSFDNSLRALGRDHVDSLLLHEVDIATANRPDVLAFLHQEQERGRITDHGLASDPDYLHGAVTQLDPTHRIVQVANSVLHQQSTSSREWRGRVVNTHGAVRFGAKLFQWLHHNPAEHRQWENDLGQP
jgi:D-threo-aldose 1-dehydrogenase